MNQCPAFVALLAALLALAACADRNGEGATPATAADGTSLPVPGEVHGSVTGMPDTPGPGHIGPPQTAGADALTDAPIADGIDPLLAGDAGIDPSSTDPSSGIPAGDTPDATPAPDEPGPAEAVAVVRAYYEAINAGDFSRAYGLWSDGGKASGQSSQQFADGFADTRAVSVEILPPGRIDSAAGSRHIEVPLALSATRADGSVHKYVGAYTLRRAVVDGATAEQRAWRIASADIREVRP
ncbi:MAG TPA: hypothetical protein VFS82_06405 [Lysobacter sp.]|nr:hypothetical protein [Lysobacter sp.]